MKRAAKYVIGIDEVGRGALAGPVVVAAVCLPANLKISNRKLGALKDSKKLSPQSRKLWVEYFKSIKEISYKAAGVHPRAIEKINISEAANKAAGRASGRLVESLRLKPNNFKIFLDGGLYLGNKSERMRIISRNGAKNFRKNSRSSSRYFASTIVRADEKITAVKIASIIAKVRRDKYMEKLSKKHPRYGFEIHKGYGTKRHLEAIRRHGPSKAHRLTFLRFSRKFQNKV